VSVLAPPSVVAAVKLIAPDAMSAERSTPTQLVEPLRMPPPAGHRCGQGVADVEVAHRQAAR